MPRPSSPRKIQNAGKEESRVKRRRPDNPRRNGRRISGIKSTVSLEVCTMSGFTDPTVGDAKSRI